MPLIASAVAGGVGALTKTGTGIAQNIKAAKIEKSNRRPTFDIQDEYFQNRDLSAGMAQYGLSGSALNYARTNSERGLGASISASLQTGAGSVADFYDSYNRSLQATAAQDAELRAERIKNYMQANNALAGQKTQKWVIDKYEPYKDKAKAAAQLRSSGMQNITTGLSDMAGIGASFATANSYQNMMDSQTDLNRQQSNGVGFNAFVPSSDYGRQVANSYSQNYGWDMSRSQMPQPQGYNNQGILQKTYTPRFVDSFDGMIESTIINNNLFPIK